MWSHIFWNIQEAGTNMEDCPRSQRETIFTDSVTFTEGLLEFLEICGSGWACPVLYSV